MKKVCHVTSVHPTTDVRLITKECASLAQAGYDVTLVGPGASREEKGVHVVGVKEHTGKRLSRMLVYSGKVYQTALEQNAELYHFHDPELLHYALKLKRRGKRVVFDSHEDVPAQIMDKQWLPAPMRSMISRLYKAYETHVVKQLDAVVAATPYIAQRFNGRAKRIAVVNNYPRLDDIMFHDTPLAEREPIACYAGGINDLRGEDIMLEAMRAVEGVLVLAGVHEKKSISLEHGGEIRYIGHVDREGINALYGRSVVGLCILKPIENYFYSQPIKVYEYMAAGLPYICSDFPGWRRLAEESGAGICVKADDPSALAQAVSMLLSDRERAQRMGRLGREYILRECNWSNEEKRLLKLYDDLGRA